MKPLHFFHLLVFGNSPLVSFRLPLSLALRVPTAPQPRPCVIPSAGFSSHSASDCWFCGPAFVFSLDRPDHGALAFSWSAPDKLDWARSPPPCQRQMVADAMRLDDTMRCHCTRDWMYYVAQPAHWRLCLGAKEPRRVRRGSQHAWLGFVCSFLYFRPAFGSLSRSRVSFTPPFGPSPSKRTGWPCACASVVPGTCNTVLERDWHFPCPSPSPETGGCFILVIP